MNVRRRPDEEKPSVWDRVESMDIRLRRVEVACTVIAIGVFSPKVGGPTAPDAVTAALNFAQSIL